MAFSLDSSLNYVKLDEPVLCELYRSISPVVPADGTPNNRPHEAYICTANDKELRKVYVSLYNPTAKTIKVFTPEQSPVTNDEYSWQVQEALSFTASLGFAMEAMNLRYSAAMRQVIMRGVPVLRPPPPPRVAARAGESHKKKGDEKPATQSKEPEPTLLEKALPVVSEPGDADIRHAEASAALEKATQELAATKAELERRIAEHAGQDHSVQETLASLKSELDKVRSTQKQTEKRLKQALNEVALQSTTSDAEKEALRTELQVVREEREAAITKQKQTEKSLRQAMAESSPQDQTPDSEKMMLRAEQQLANDKLEAAYAMQKQTEERLEQALAQSSNLSKTSDAEKEALHAELQEAKDNLESAVALHKQTEESLNKALAESAELNKTSESEKEVLHAELLTTIDKLESAFALQKQTEESLNQALAESSILSNTADSEKEALYTELQAAKDKLEKTFNMQKQTEESLNQALAEVSLLNTAADPEKEELRAELLAVRAELEKNITCSDTVVRALNEDLARLRAAHEDLHQQLQTAHDEAARQIADLRGELAVKEEERTTACTELAAIRRNYSTLEQELTEIDGVKAEQLATLTEEVERLRDENKIVEQHSAREMKSLKARLKKVDTERMTLKSELEQLTTRFERLKAVFTQKMDASRAEIAALWQELKDQQEAFDREKERLITDISGLREETTGLCSEVVEEAGWTRVEQDIASPVICSSLATRKGPDVAEASVVPLDWDVMVTEPAPADSQPQALVSSADTFGSTSLSDFRGFGTCDGDPETAQTEFKTDSSLSFVPINSPSEIVAVYESSNKIQAMLDGCSSQRCGSYICVVNTNGVPRVYLAWLLLESNETRFYVPARQAENQAGLEKIIKDAVFFFESTGFMMEPVHLDQSSRKRESAIKRIPIIRHVSHH